MSLPKPILDYARGIMDRAHEHDHDPRWADSSDGRVCAGCRQWVACIWHGTLDGTELCYACAGEAERQAVARRLAAALMRLGSIPAEVMTKARAHE